VKLLFISYINRSGSTFLANEFSKYNSILVCPEAEVLVYYFIQQKEPLFSQAGKLRSLLTDLFSGDPKLKHWGLTVSDFVDTVQYKNNFEVFVEILKKYRDRVKPEASIILFKADTIAYFCNQIPEEFYKRYGINIISIIRDGRASYASQRETVGARKQKPMSRNPVKAAILWKKWIKFYSNHLNDPRFIYIRYEEMINEFESQFHQLLLDLNLNSEVESKTINGDLYDRIPPIQRTMHQNVLRSPLPEKIEMWKQILPPIHIIILEKIAEIELMQMGYPLLSPDTNKILTYIVLSYYWILYYYQSSLIRRWIRKVVWIVIFKTSKIFSPKQLPASG